MWVNVELIVTNENIIIGKQKITYGEIKNLNDIYIEGIRCIQINTNGTIIFQISQFFHQQVIRYIISKLKGDKFVVYMMLSATISGIVSPIAKWEKGYLIVTNEALWFITKTSELRIGNEKIGYIKKDIRTIEGKMRKVLSLSYVEDEKIITSFLLCPENTLEMIENYTTSLIKLYNPEVILSKVEEQILTLLYTKVDNASIEKITGLSLDELNKYFDRFIDSELVKVTKIRKEVELTPLGIKRVDQISFVYRY